MRAPIKELPSQAELLRLFDYDPVTGVLRWRIRPPNAPFKAGSVAGTLGTRGYVVIGIRRKYYYAQRLIWKLVTGIDPDDQIDHADLDRSNNRWSNLRQADNGKNRWNSKLAKNNTTGFKGVVRKDRCRKFYAILQEKSKGAKRLGGFDTAEEAAQAWQAAAAERRGEFFRAA